MSASELWLRLQEMPRPSRIVDFPRKGPDGDFLGKIRIWVLTQEEQMICASAAEKFAKERLKDGKRDDLGYETVYANASVVEVLYRTCRDAEEPSRPFFPTPQAIRQTLTADECGRLFEAYLSVELELGPVVAKLEPVELDAWIDRIAEGGLAAGPFDSASRDMQKVLAFSMAYLIRELRKDKSSVGSQPEGTPKSESS